MTRHSVPSIGLVGLYVLVASVQANGAAPADPSNALTFPIAVSGDAGFIEQPEFGVGLTIPIAWRDYDNDGDLDLAVGNQGGRNQVFVNNGDGTFTELRDLGNQSTSTFALVWGDFDNDGDADAAVGNSGTNLLFVNNGDGTFEEREEFSGTRTIALAWGDYDNDGDLDMAVGNGILGFDEQNYLCVNNGDGTFTEQPAFGINQTDSLVWGDYDNDGDLDLAVGNGGFGKVQQNYLYVNNGDGTFAEQPQFGTGDTASVAWADADNDGDLDLAVGNWDATSNYLYVNNGDGSFTEIGTFGTGRFDSRDTNTVAWGDYNNDGLQDLAVGNGDFTSADQNFLYVNNGGGSFTEVAEFGLGSTDSLAWGDYDNDGDLDVACGNEHTPLQNYLYVNTFDGNRPLVLHLIGHVHDQGAGFSNRDGVGAKVSVYESGFVGESDHLLGFREVSAHGGFSSQNTIDPTFGLPGHDTVDVRIAWPGSQGLFIIQDVIGVSVPDDLIVDEAGEPGTGGCTMVESPANEASGIARNRYLSLDPGNPGEASALRVTMVALSGYEAFDGQVRWVGPPSQFTDEGAGPFMAAALQCEPFFTDWSQIGPVSVFGAEVVPESTYAVAAVHETCADALDDEGNFSETITISTAKWGDIVAPFFVGGGPAQPDFGDIASLVDKFTAAPTAPLKVRAQLQPTVVRPDSPIDFSDISADIDAFVGAEYGFAGPTACP
jgi:hypothetical protein